MNAKKYYEWSQYYDPDRLELACLKNKGIDFSNKKVLEVGCGTGRFTCNIIRIVNELMAIDPDEDAINICRQNLSAFNTSFKVGTLETLPIRSNYYDFVVFSWSMYLIGDKSKNLRIAFDALRNDGSLIVLQANSGEFEEEVAKLYSHYESLEAYRETYSCLKNAIEDIFGNVDSDKLVTHFIFDNVDKVIDSSLFFIVDEEKTLPSKERIAAFRERIKRYKTLDGKVKMSDVVSLFIAKKIGG